MFAIMKLLISILFFASLYGLIHGTATKFGPYCIANKGFYPHKVTVEDLKEQGLEPNITYEAWLSNSKQECEKKVRGYWTIHRKIETIGLFISMERYSDGVKLPGGSGNDIMIENLCDSTFPMEPFNKRFNGTLGDDCSLEPGVYTLWDWTLYDHMKDIIPSMQLALYEVNLCWLENKQKCVLQNKITMDFKDASTKEAEERMANSGGYRQAKKDRDRHKHKKEENYGEEDWQEKGEQSYGNWAGK